MPQSDSSFSPEVIDHFLHPRNVGTVERATAAVELENEICGDRMEMSVRVSGDKIESIKFRSQGCAVAIASASKLTLAVTGRSISESDALARAAVAGVGDGHAPRKTALPRYCPACLAAIVGKDQSEMKLFRNRGELI